MRILVNTLCLLSILGICASDSQANTNMRLKRPAQPQSVSSFGARTVISVPLSNNSFAKIKPSHSQLNLSSFVRNNFLKVPPRPVSSAKLMRLNNKDVIVFIDKSSSMKTEDINNGVSRWDWSKSQLADLTNKLRAVPKTSLDLVFFNSGARKYKSVKMNSLPVIFSQNYPFGGTNITRALDEEIDNFFSRRAHTTVRKRPLVIAVITDGAPSSSRALKELIKKTTLKLNNPKELKITFLQVGFDDKGNRLMPELDHRLVRDGAKFDIVDTKTFRQVGKMGLVNALIDAVS